MKKLFLCDIASKFNLEILSGQDKISHTQIKSYGLNRAGLELAGFFETMTDNLRRLVLLSSKEFHYMQQFDDAVKTEKYETLIKCGIPGIIVTKKFHDPQLVAVAQKLNFPLLFANMDISTSTLTKKILDEYDDYFAPQLEMHASLVNIFGKGILITGASGIGKSETTMDIIKRNHMFVGDDRIVLINKNNKIYGKSHPILQNLIEMRGIGIVDVSWTNGYQAIMTETEINMQIELIPFGQHGIDDTDRLGNEYKNVSILDQNIPYLKIPVKAGRNIANLIETAVAQLKIKETGKAKDVVELVGQRMEDFIDDK
ncbi:HPr(Ser) kinase/phosphatase [Williamsoniiplasma lucivorax]|uniref:HPr kinase/phosphorylase n=1 Tax=Williamsoniiplasma lucivorax TaxID=209274 RepID=A0A2S5RET1_9MOLU|nr:HPr(Ser) kinase/phosphatase [Williamsoniiplasma lucivorax]PPE05821.1 HPr kinase/phosphorylase [Williamsoniiplasma lucivorax]